MPNMIRVRDVEKIIDRDRNTILRWEREGKIPHPQKDSRGWRFYTQEDIEKIREYISKSDSRKKAAVRRTISPSAEPVTTTAETAISAAPTGQISFAQPAPISKVFTPATDERIRHIILIDDEPETMETFGTKLQAEGFKVLSALNGKDGLKLVMDKIPDLVLLDLVMPGEDGYEVLKALKAQYQTKNIPVIAFSNLGADEDIKEAMRLGAREYLTKANLTPAELADRVKKILEKQN